MQVQADAVCPRCRSGVQRVRRTRKNSGSFLACLCEDMPLTRNGQGETHLRNDVFFEAMSRLRAA